MGQGEFSVIIVRGNRFRATRNEKAWPPKQAFLSDCKDPGSSTRLLASFALQQPSRHKVLVPGLPRLKTGARALLNNG